MASNSNVAKLILQLVDRVSGPAKAVAGSLRMVSGAASGLTAATMAPARAVREMGRGIRRTSTDLTALSTVTAVGVGAAAKAVYDYEKAGNKMQAFGLLGDEQRAALEARAQQLNKDFPFTNKDIIRAAQELFRAGLTYEQAMGALRGSLNLALAGDLDIKEATDIATNVMTAMKLPMNTFDQVQDSLLRVNDALAYAATNSNTDVRLMGDTFRYVAPLAAAAGMELEQVTAVAMELARAGIKGSEAGVAVRSALVRMAKPTKPMLAAFERLGISMKDFVKYREEMEASSIVSSLLPSGIDASALSGEIQAILDDTTLKAAPARMGAALTDLVVKSLGDEALRDEVSSVINDAVLSGAQQVDLLALLKTLREKGATITDISRIFDVRMGSRLAAILGSDLDAAVDKVKSEYYGVGEKMAEQMMRGIVGVVARIVAAFENLVIKMAESGVLDTISEVMDKISNFVVELSKANPDLLKFGTYAFLGLAAMAPLGLALSGFVSALSLAINPLFLAGTALAGWAAINYGPIKSFFKATAKFFTDSLDPKVADQFSIIGEKMRGWGKDLASAGEDGSAWARAAKYIGEHTAGVLNRAQQDAEDLEKLRLKFIDFWGWMKGFPDQLAQSFEGTPGALGDWIVQQTSSADAAMTKFNNDFQVWYDGLVAKATRSVSEGGASLLSWLDNAVDRGLDGMTRFANESDIWLQDFGRSMVEALGVAADAIYEAGAEFFRQYWEGLKSEAGIVLEWASGIAAKLKSFFSFSASPSINPQYKDVSLRPNQTNGTLNNVISNVDGKKAAGGAVRRGLTYEINERGRETVTMGTNGYVTPAHKADGAGTTIKNIFHISGGNADEVAQTIVRELDRQLTRAPQLSIDGRLIR